MTKLRMSNHLLNIDKGRRMDVPRGERTCPYCPSEKEDELHFLLKCDKYKHERAALFEYIPTISNFPNDRTKIESLMLEHFKLTAKFTHQAFKERTLHMDVSHETDVVEKSLMTILHEEISSNSLTGRTLIHKNR